MFSEKHRFDVILFCGQGRFRVTPNEVHWSILTEGNWSRAPASVRQVRRLGLRWPTGGSRPAVHTEHLHPFAPHVGHGHRLG